MDTAIIKATNEHVDLLSPLFDAYRQFYGQPSALKKAKEFLSQRLERDQSAVFIAMHEEHACGFTQLYPTFSSVAMNGIWILNDLFVRPDAQRRGVGTALMEAATRFAKENAATRLVLATAINNKTAQALYERLGWKRDENFVHFVHEL